MIFSLFAVDGEGFVGALGQLALETGLWKRVQRQIMRLKSPARKLDSERRHPGGVKGMSEEIDCYPEAFPDSKNPLPLNISN